MPSLTIMAFCNFILYVLYLTIHSSSPSLQLTTGLPPHPPDLPVPMPASARAPSVHFLALTLFPSLLLLVS